MQCPQCGSESAAEHAKFCIDCGTSLSPEPHDTGATDNERQEPVSDSSLLYQGKLRPNRFSEFYAPATETPRWRKGLLVALLLAIIAGAIATGVYYYSHRKYEISELAKLPPTAPAAPAVPARPISSQQDSIFPCPSEAPFCIGTAASKIKDQACDADKPVWAHYSEDGGITWKRAGCYATEAQARQGLSDTLGLAGPKARRLSETPKKTTEAASNKHTAIQAAKPANHTENNSSEPQQQHYLAFKGPFGITVEKRSYPSEQMKQKALDLWEREKKILEPDGSINDKYVVKQKIGSGLIPGH